MGSGCVIYTLVACTVGWISPETGVWQKIGMIAAQLAAAFLIRIFFLLHYRREAKEMNKRIQEMKKGKDSNPSLFRWMRSSFLFCPASHSAC